MEDDETMDSANKLWSHDGKALTVKEQAERQTMAQGVCVFTLTLSKSETYIDFPSLASWQFLVLLPNRIVIS